MDVSFDIVDEMFDSVLNELLTFLNTSCPNPPQLIMMSEIFRIIVAVNIHPEALEMLPVFQQALLQWLARRKHFISTGEVDGKSTFVRCPLRIVHFSDIDEALSHYTRASWQMN
jgi:hypothetical protein